MHHGFTILFFISILSQARAERLLTSQEFSGALEDHATRSRLISRPSKDSINVFNRFLLANSLAALAPKVDNFEYYGVLTLHGSNDARSLTLYIDTKSAKNPKQVYILRSKQNGGSTIKRPPIVEPVEDFLQRKLKPSQKLFIETGGGNAIRKWESLTLKKIDWDSFTATNWDDARTAYAKKFVLKDEELGIDIDLDAAKNLPDASLLFQHSLQGPLFDELISDDVKMALKKSIVAVHMINEALSNFPELTSAQALSDARYDIHKMVSGGADGLQLFEIKYVEAALALSHLRDFGGFASEFCS